MLQLLILLLTVLVTSGTECPTMCFCKHFPREIVPTNYLYYSVIKCEGFNSNSSETLSNSTRNLEVSLLDKESFSALVESLSKSDLPELNTLALRRSFVSNVSALLQAAGGRIKFLQLSQNSLTSVPNLTDSLSIVSLDLSGNVISSLSSLRTLNILETLNLSRNSLQEIKTDSFQNLTSLKILDLSQNNFSSLNHNLFVSLTVLQYLNLSHNNLEVLKDKLFFSLVKLQSLDVSWNNLARIAPGALQLPNLARLLLAGNVELGDSSEILVGVGQKVHTVDASRMRLEQVPVTLTRSIRTLQLAGNLIRTVSCGELDAYPLLQFLDFTSNHIVLIEEDALGRLEFLRVLYLAENKLGSIPRSLPEELTLLHLGNNVIENVLKDDLYGLSNLEVLLLNDNKITIVEGGAFRYLHSLITLDLSRNSIKALYSGSLSGPSALQILRLSGIDTVAPAEDVSFPLSATDHLVSLDLSGSAGLARQLLADTAVLVASRELQELDISGADLQFIRADLLHFLPQLRIMHVEDNRLNCTNLHWLAQWMRRQDQAGYRSITCASPAELWGTPLLDLQYAEIPPIKQINHEKGQQFEGTINLVRKDPAAEKNNSSRKYATQRTTTIKNGAINNVPATTTSKTSDKKALAAKADSVSNNMHLNLLKENYAKTLNQVSVLDQQIVNDNMKSGKKFTLKHVLTKKKGATKTVNKVLVSSADVGVSSLIPVSNEQKEYLTRATKDLNYTGPPNISDSINATSSMRFLPLPNNGPIKALKPTRNSLNLASAERIFGGASGLTEKNQSSENGMQLLTEVNITESIPGWNASRVKTSMYRNDENPTRILHPGMLILAVGILGGTVTLVILTARLNIRKRWAERGEDSEDIPVSSISSVTELW